MLHHLLTPEALSLAQEVAQFAPQADALDEFLPDDDATASQILNGKSATLHSLPTPPPRTEQQVAERTFLWAESVDSDSSTEDDVAQRVARSAFTALTAGDPANAKKAVLALKVPDAVNRAVGMLTAYDWAFVEQAQNIRSYIVTSLLEESKNPKAEVRLKALKMLGDVTEIGLFTQRVEVTTKNLSDDQLEEEIRARLERLTVDVSAVEVVSPSDSF